MYKDYFLIRKNSKFTSLKIGLIDSILSRFIKSKSVKIKDPKKMLIIRNGKIGDLVLSSGIFREIKKKFPNLKITLICSNSNYPIIEKNKNIDESIILNFAWRKNPFKTLKNYLKVFKRIKNDGFNVGVDLGLRPINFIFMKYARIKKRVSYYNFNGGKPFLTDPVQYEKEVHTTISDLELVNKSLNMKSKNSFPEIITDENDEKELKKLIQKHKLKKFICIVPDASFEKKQWPLEKFNALTKYLQLKYPSYKIFLVGSDEEKIDYLFNKNPETIKLINENLRVVYLLFKKSYLIIAQDGGAMHLAGVSNSNLIALMSSHLNLKHIGPVGKNSHIIYKNLNNISLEDVKKEIKKINL